MKRKQTLLIALTAVVATVLTVAASGALGASPSSGTISMTSPTASWTGGPFIASNPVGCVAGSSDPTCDSYFLTVDRPENTKKYRVEVIVKTANTADDFDVFVYDADGNEVDSSTNSGTPPNGERAIITDTQDATYEVQVQPWLVDPGATYQAQATITEVDDAPPPTDPNSVLYEFDESKAEATVSVPLRVVLVGFQQGEVDAAKVLSQIPTSQRPGVLIPRPEHEQLSDDCGVLLGANTLVNHGRCYYRDVTPYLVPNEFQWKPELIYAPATFTKGLFAAMRANSTTGDFDSDSKRAFIERYNATRGAAFRGLDKQVAPNAPVRFIDAEKVEDWLAQNSRQHLGFELGSTANGIPQPGVKPGYTVFVLNTWDSPYALTELRPQNEYHVFKVVRIDPDTNTDEGIDWARVWGGRYREMILDLGAAPNAYEAESWGNNGDPAAGGSEAYEPPLWEYRANAPRPLVLGYLPDPEQTGQAVSPGNTWDKDDLEYNIGRFVNEAASFRFLHSYLYEPRPQTGKYYLSSNIWHDQKADAPWASDLTKLYDEQAVLSGLRTLVPYFSFTGDTAYETLSEGKPGYTADQAALDQAKADGDDIAGASHTAMNTLTMMNYLDGMNATGTQIVDPQRRARFYRGGSCYTTVPNLNVVVEKHYAWSLPIIVAGIAPDRFGVPWGFLASVNDLTKWPGSDKEQLTAATHPSAFSGTFSYTAIHELSHYLGLAHPHDTVGASKIGGKTVYWDGFTWSFNSTAAPTTYSHDELTYSILDQESVARGHTAYYLRWTSEALRDAGEAFAASGKTTLDKLDDSSRKLRAGALSLVAASRKDYARFQFIPATFAAQKAWRHAAALRDRALRLPRGSSELEQGTKLAGAEGCPSSTLG
jgi:hypothetical protein